MIRKFAFLTALFLFFSSAVFGQSAGDKEYTLYYYGVVTNVNDTNMLNITQDLFAAQIRSIDYVSLIDKRNDAIKNSYEAVSADTEGKTFFGIVQKKNELQEDSIIFYTRIYRSQSDEKWECTFFAKNIQNETVASKTRSYDSYYKILSDAKLLIQNVLSEACGNISPQAAPPQAITEEKPQSLNVENIAGTWSGESDISKIILMRSGRGFIVFTNGATMNITVSLLGDGGRQRLRIVQQDKFNASYYPDIDRKTILAYADGASPIEWNLALTPKGTLEGKKKTLSASTGKVEPANIDVVWTKK